MARRFRSYIAQHHIALLALFVALGGTSYAAINLPKNSVGPNQIATNAVGGSEIRKNAVAASELKGNAVNSAKVKNGSLTAADFAPGQIQAGAKGDRGDAGANGRDGARELAAAVIARPRGSSTVTAPDDDNAFADYPLNGANYTQAADETDSIVGEVTLTRPATCPLGSASFSLEVRVGNTVVAEGGENDAAPNPPGPGTRTINLRSLNSLFEPGTAVGRTVTARLRSPGCPSGGRYSVSAVKVNVIGLR